MHQRGAQLTPLADLDDLRRLVTGRGEVLSVCLPLRPANEDLPQEVRLEWRAMREEAARMGAPPEGLEVVDRAIQGAHRESAGLHVVVPAEGEPHVEGLARPPARPSVTWGPVPALVPVVADRQRRQPHVVALVDRQGADIVASTGRIAGPPGAPDAPGAEAAMTTTVEGETFPLRKVAAGGWLQRRFQQHAEETWRHNMAEVAAELARQVERVDARFVAVGGDERAVGLLVDHLPAWVRELVRPIAVTRAIDGSSSRLADEVTRVLDGWVDVEIGRTLDAYREELGQDDRAVAGTADTLAALRAARVAQLLVDGTSTGDDAGIENDATGANDAAGGAGPAPPATGGDGGGRTARAWVGAGPEDVGLTREELLAPDEARPANAIDSAVAAALATGADVRILPAEPEPEDGERPAELEVALPGGLGALLRW